MSTSKIISKMLTISLNRGITTATTNIFTRNIIHSPIRMIQSPISENISPRASKKSVISFKLAKLLAISGKGSGWFSSANSVASYRASVHKVTSNSKVESVFTKPLRVSVSLLFATRTTEKTRRKQIINVSSFFTV